MISIIILNHNDSNYTIQCLISLRNQTYDNFEIIIVENNSETYYKSTLINFLESNKLEHKFLEKIKILYSDRHLGYAGGNNLAIKNSKGDIILHLDNDTIHSPSFLEIMCKFFEKYKFVHIAQPIIYYLKEKKKIWCNGYKFNKFSNDIIQNLIYLKKESIAKPYKIDSADGCAFFIRKAVLKKTGLYESIFNIYGETSELCYRARMNGFTNIYCNPQAKIYHDTKPGFSDLHKHLFFRNRMIFFLLHFSLLLIIWQFFMQIVQLFFLTFDLKNRKIDHKFIIYSIKGAINGIIIGLKKRLNK